MFLFSFNQKVLSINGIKGKKQIRRTFSSFKKWIHIWSQKMKISWKEGNIFIQKTLKAFLYFYYLRKILFTVDSLFSFHFYVFFSLCIVNFSRLQQKLMLLFIFWSSIEWIKSESCKKIKKLNIKMRSGTKAWRK